MLLEGNSYWKFMITVALSCTDLARPDEPLDAERVAKFICDVLRIAAGPQKRQVYVQAVPYCVTTKVPLLLSTDAGPARLFWYYPQQDDETLSEHLSDLMPELELNLPVSATA
jgi:hypothetical protein